MEYTLEEVHGAGDSEIKDSELLVVNRTVETRFHGRLTYITRKLRLYRPKTRLAILHSDAR